MKYRVVEKDNGLLYLQCKGFLTWVDCSRPPVIKADVQILINLVELFNKPHQEIFHKIIKVVYP